MLTPANVTVWETTGGKVKGFGPLFILDLQGLSVIIQNIPY